MTVVHDLQQRVPDLRVGLFDLVEEQHLIRPSAHLFGELAALLVANIAWRGAKEFADGVSFAIFAHIDSQKCVFAVEEEGGQDPGQFGFADAGGPEEEEGANGPAGVFQAAARSADRIADSLYGPLLANNSQPEVVFHSEQLFHLLFEQVHHRNTCPTVNDCGDVGGVYHVIQVGIGFPGLER